MIDKIALQYVYMAIIRSQVHNFVEVWNHHYIRKQKNREEYLIHGRPSLLYQGQVKPGQAIDRSCGSMPDTTDVSQLLSLVDSFDLDAFLTPSTLDLCNKYMAEGGFQMPSSLADPPKDVYIFLRTKLQDHVRLRLEPAITSLSPPKGNLRWIREAAQEAGLLEDENGEFYESNPLESLDLDEESYEESVRDGDQDSED
jgi:hypothetical protein